MATEYRTVHVALAPYDHDELCPKCHFMPATTEYYAGIHNAAGRQCTLPGAGLMVLGGVFRGMGEDRKPPNVEYVMPEHFERQCPNCGHRWAEAVH